jgi:hypothetical protein
MRPKEYADRIAIRHPQFLIHKLHLSASYREFPYVNAIPHAIYSNVIIAIITNT